MTKKHHKYSLLGFQALKRAAAWAAREARMNNHKVPYWEENGKISVEVPELITEQSTPPDRHPATQHSSGWAAMRVLKLSLQQGRHPFGQTPCPGPSGTGVPRHIQTQGGISFSRKNHHENPHEKTFRN
jgi:hypothetical protein